MTVLGVVWDFFLDFVIGDDPKIAAAVVGSLVVAGVLLVTGAVGASAALVVGAVLVVVSFTVTLVVDVRRGRT
jgi:hypothetical protein